MKVPEPRKLPSGTYFIQLRLGGQSVPISAPTRRECIQQAQLKKAEHRAGLRTTAPKTDQTLRQIMQAYIDALPPDTSPSTVRGYYIIMDNRFPSVIDTPVSRIDWSSVMEALTAKYSHKTLKNTWGFLTSCLRSAGVPTPDANVPKQKKQSPMPHFLEPEQILQVLPLLRGKKYEIPALLALHSLRRSEIMALDYSDIDLKKNTITVHGALVPDKNNDLVYRDENKTLSSQRVIPIMIPRLAELIRESGHTSGRIWSKTPHGLYHTMEKICKTLGVPNVGAHGLRHSFASLAYHLRFSEMETMEIGGWSDHNTMRKIYTHLARMDRLKAQNSMAQFYRAADARQPDCQTSARVDLSAFWTSSWYAAANVVYSDCYNANENANEK